MIGRDQIDDSIAQALPQRFAVGSRADWRRAFEQRAAGRNLFGEEVQVMGTGLHRNRQALGASLGQILERQGSGEMNDVQRKRYLRQSPISMRMAANSASSGRERR